MDQLWSGILGVLVMFGTSLGKQPHWSRRVKVVLLTGLSIVAAFLQLLLQQKLSLKHLGNDVSIILSSATVVYHTYFERTNTNTKLANYRFST